MQEPNSTLCAAATLEVVKNHVWVVAYTAKLPLSAISPEDLVCPDCGEKHNIEEVRTICDTVTILEGPDGQDAINRVFEKVMGTNATNLPVLTDFNVTGLKLIAVVEVL